jgi:phage terminase small subunit
MAKLTPKQKQFVQEYLVDLNGAQAAIRAGYSKKTAKVQAARLLTNVNIQNRIAELMDKRSQRTDITADRVLRELAHIAFDDIKNYLSFQAGPIGEIEVLIKDSGNIDTRNISEVSIGKDGQFKFKLYCKDNALVQLGKHLGIFTEKVSMDVSPSVGILGEILEQLKD